ncbi:MAG: spore photoproduct lyase family protein [Oscillospiraceae bacterium]
MSVNPPALIRRIELGTSKLAQRINAVNSMCAAGYPTGILVAPVILTPDWKEQYDGLFTQLADTLSNQVKRQLFVEVILATYSYVHRMTTAMRFPTPFCSMIRN